MFQFRNLILVIIILIFNNPGQAQSEFRSAYRFIENKGQLNPEIKFQADIPGGTIFLLKNRIIYDLIDKTAIHEYKTGNRANKTHQNNLLASAIRAP